MHLHAWNTPPKYNLTVDDCKHQPYLIEYPTDQMYEKIAYMTKLLKKTFQCDIASHRAGRWALNANYAKILSEFGYTVDCTVYPYRSYKHELGDPNGNGGVDYSNFPTKPYFLDLNNIKLEGKSKLLEIPMTIEKTSIGKMLLLIKPLKIRFFMEKLVNKFIPIQASLRPNGDNLKQILWLLHKISSTNHDYIMFMIHSSEFMPGGSYTFDNEEKIEILFNNMRSIFEKISITYKGSTLSEYLHEYQDLYRVSYHIV